MSVEDIKRIYDRLNTTFEVWEGESDGNQYIPEMVEYIESKGLVSDSEGARIIEVKEENDEDYYIVAMKKMEDVTLRNVYFKFDSAELTPESDDGIKEVYEFLMDYPELKIELAGHTDDVGDEKYNQILSERRAESVANELINKGISAERIKTKGCGSTQPLFPNNFDELRDFNRRVSMGFSQ